MNNKIVVKIEKRGIDNNCWIWEPPNYSKNYVVCVYVECVSFGNKIIGVNNFKSFS